MKTRQDQLQNVALPILLQTVVVPLGLLMKVELPILFAVVPSDPKVEFPILLYVVPSLLKVVFPIRL
jgi:hypothetical protein